VKNHGTPIVSLAGGPGAPTLTKLEKLFPNTPGWSSFPFPLFSFLKFPEIANFVGDLILVEPRSVGHSRPRLDCPGTYDLPLNKPLSYEILIDAARKYFENCVKFWKGRNIDLFSYNTHEMASDIDLLRQALGYDKISLLGYSFGSSHGQAMLKYYGEHIEKAVLISIVNPEQTSKNPRSKFSSLIQNNLEKLANLVRGDQELSRRIPDLLDLIGTVLKRLEKRPVTVEIPDPDTGEKVIVTLGKFDLQAATRNLISDTHFLQALPAHYYTMSQGNFNWLAEWALKFRRRRNLRMVVSTVACIKRASTERFVSIEQEAKQTLLGNKTQFPIYELCDILGDIDLKDRFRDKVESEVPVLLIGGNLDAHTPISNATEVLKGLVNGQLLVIEGVAHDIYSGGPEVIQKIFQAISKFLKGEPQSTTVIKAPFKFDSKAPFKCDSKI
jgi:pimeloyl-ACP methyl ester carboxylesterase